MKRSRTKNNWIREHLADEYVKKSKIDGFRSRAAYKFLQLNEKHSLLGVLTGWLTLDQLLEVGRKQSAHCLMTPDILLPLTFFP